MYKWLGAYPFATLDCAGRLLPLPNCIMQSYTHFTTQHIQRQQQQIVIIKVIQLNLPPPPAEPFCSMLILKGSPSPSCIFLFILTCTSIVINFDSLGNTMAVKLSLACVLYRDLFNILAFVMVFVYEFDKALPSSLKSFKLLPELPSDFVTLNSISSLVEYLSLWSYLKTDMV